MKLNETAILFILSFFWLSCISQSQGEVLEISQAQQFKDSLIFTIAENLDFGDTLFLAVDHELEQCGNDYNEYDEKPSETQYYIDFQKGFDEIYDVNGNTVITGIGNMNYDFYSKNFHFDYDELINKKNFYDILYTNMKRDTVSVIVQNPYMSEAPKLEFTMYLSDDRWTPSEIQKR